MYADQLIFAMKNSILVGSKPLAHVDYTELTVAL